jgi:phage gp29-like protein
MRNKQLDLGYSEEFARKVKAEYTPKERTESPIKYVLEQQKLRTRQDLLSLRLAVDSAENIKNPNREMLHDIYRQIIIDPQLESQWGSRKLKTKERAFKIIDIASKEEDEVATEVFEAEWFLDWVDACLDSRLWGFSLIEFGDLVNGEFLPFSVGNRNYPPVQVVDRDNVKPEFRIITNSPGMVEGVSFDDPRFSKHLMFVGSYCSKGLLFNLAKPILFKDNTLGNWSEWAEVFGMDKRVGYTAAQGDARTKFLTAIRDMGTNAYGVFGDRDRVEYLGTQRQDAYQVYLQFINYIDSQIAKMIFGQDVVSNNTGQVVGEVGENMADMYGQADARFIKMLVNKKLIPLMGELGFNMKGKRFIWDTEESMSMSQRIEVDFKLTQMGYKHDLDYLNNTYGTSLEEVEKENPTEFTDKLKALYKSVA